MNTGTRLLARLDAVEARLSAAASREPVPGALTGADPESGERWDRGQVWAHLSEFIPYWIAAGGTGAARSAFWRAGAVRADQE